MRVRDKRPTYRFIVTLFKTVEDAKAHKNGRLLYTSKPEECILNPQFKDRNRIIADLARNVGLDPTKLRKEITYIAADKVPKGYSG